LSSGPMTVSGTSPVRFVRNPAGLSGTSPVHLSGTCPVHTFRTSGPEVGTAAADFMQLMSRRTDTDHMKSADLILRNELWLASLAYAAGRKPVGHLYFAACWGIPGVVLYLRIPFADRERPRQGAVSLFKELFVVPVGGYRGSGSSRGPRGQIGPTGRAHPPRVDGTRHARSLPEGLACRVVVSGEQQQRRRP